MSHVQLLMIGMTNVPRMINERHKKRTCTMITTICAIESAVASAGVCIHEI